MFFNGIVEKHVLLVWGIMKAFSASMILPGVMTAVTIVVEFDDGCQQQMWLTDPDVCNSNSGFDIPKSNKGCQSAFSSKKLSNVLQSDDCPGVSLELTRKKENNCPFLACGSFVFSS